MEYEENKYYSCGDDGDLYILKIINEMALCIEYSYSHKLYNYTTHTLEGLKEYGYTECDCLYFMDELEFKHLDR